MDYLTVFMFCLSLSTNISKKDRETGLRNVGSIDSNKQSNGCLDNELFQGVHDLFVAACPDQRKIYNNKYNKV